MNKKELTRAYKQNRRPMGIYRVHNTSNGRSLVGRSVDLPAILNRERAQLRLGVHRNAALQRDWNQLGAAAFVFEVLDTFSPPDEAGYDPAEDLKVLEALWLERLEPFDDRGYTARPKART
jgi:hypothetical protein